MTRLQDDLAGDDSDHKCTDHSIGMDIKTTQVKFVRPRVSHYVCHFHYPSHSTSRHLPI